MTDPLRTIPNTDDDLQWLEEVQGTAALDWVRGQNEVTQAELTARPEYGPTRAQLLEVLNASDRIPFVARRGAWLYNFWQDDAHKRGLWRRTTLAQYRLAAPQWETVIDLDALAKAENENWVWGGANCLGPDYRHCLISLSRGGADAKVVREFDAVDKRFVDGGFELPEAKSDVEWIDADTLFVGTDFGPGSKTDSGYPRIIKRWQRGTPLSTALTVFEGETTDVSVGVSVDKTPGFERTLFSRATDFYNQKYFLLEGKDLVPLDIPSDATPSFLRDLLLLSLRRPPGGRQALPERLAALHGRIGIPSGGASLAAALHAHGHPIPGRLHVHAGPCAAQRDGQRREPPGAVAQGGKHLDRAPDRCAVPWQPGGRLAA